MYLLDLRDRVKRAGELTTLTEEISTLASVVYDEMDAEETFWIFAPSESMSDEFWPVGMAVADAIRDDSPFVLKNVISRYRETAALRKEGLADVYEEILFLVKDVNEYFFDKDPIRIQHVYEGNEWNDREIGNSSYHDFDVKRYNPKGKDPGNVWLNEIRTETDDETVDHVKPIPRTEAILRCILAGSQEGEQVVVAGFDDVVIEMVEEEGRRAVDSSVGQLLGE